MPLHADREGGQPVGDLQGLDRPVGRPRRGHQASTDPVHRLVVVRRRVHPGLVVPRGQQPSQRPFGPDPDQMPPEPAVRPGVLLVPDHLGQVLVQRPAPEHVEQLDTPADGQQRPPGHQRRVEQRQLPAVPLGVRRAGLRVRASAVPGRVDVPAAGHDQPVQVGHGGGGFGRVATDRQQHRPAAAAPHRVHIGLRDQGSGGVPVPPLGQIVVGRDTDQRAHNHLGHCYRF
jgi:hypothetical protein